MQSSYNYESMGYAQPDPVYTQDRQPYTHNGDASTPAAELQPLNNVLFYQDTRYDPPRIIVYRPEDVNQYFNPHGQPLQHVQPAQHVQPPQQYAQPLDFTAVNTGYPQQDIRLNNSDEQHSDDDVPIKPPRHPREGWPKYKWPMVQVIFVMNMLLMGYDVSNIANIQAPIYHAFGHIELLPWVAVGYSALVCAAIPLYIKLSTRFPLKTLWLVGQALAFIGCTISGASQNFNALIIGRVLLGIGGAGILSIGPLFNVQLSTVTEYPKIVGLAGMAFSAGLMLGPIIGGAFEENEHATWRWAIYINLPIIAINSLLSLLFIPNIHLNPPTTSVATRLKSIDWLGFFLHSTFVVLLTIVIVFSGSTWPWSSGAAIATWVLVGLLGIFYLAQQTLGLFIRAPLLQNRLIPLHVLTYHRAILPILLATFASASGYGIPLYYTPLFFAFARGLGPLAAAIRLFPFLSTLIVAIILGAGSLPRVRIFAPQYILGGACIAAGSAAQAFITAETSESRVMGISALIGFGTGLIYQLGPGVLSQLVKKYGRGGDVEQLKRDTAHLSYVFQLGGIAFMLSIAGCVFQNIGFLELQKAFGSVPGVNFSDAEIAEALAGLDSPIWRKEGVASQGIILLAVDAVTRSLARVYWIPFAGGVATMICGFLMGFEKLEFEVLPAADAEKGKGVVRFSGEGEESWRSRPGHESMQMLMR